MTHPTSIQGGGYRLVVWCRELCASGIQIFRGPPVASESFFRQREPTFDRMRSCLHERPQRYRKRFATCSIFFISNPAPVSHPRQIGQGESSKVLKNKYPSMAVRLARDVTSIREAAASVIRSWVVAKDSFWRNIYLRKFIIHTPAP